MPISIVIRANMAPMNPSSMKAQQGVEFALESMSFLKWKPTTECTIDPLVTVQTSKRDAWK
jgi:hypothetical protein